MLKTLIEQALKEDLPGLDMTLECIGDKSPDKTATIVAKEPGVFYGVDVINEVVSCVDSTIQITQTIQDGDRFEDGDIVCTLHGPAQHLVRAERVLLNFIQRLSGVATTTATYIAALDDASIDILDTRKTTPLMRDLEKKAVLAGGGKNHRMNLSDMALIKENHLELFMTDHSPEQLSVAFKQFKEKHPRIKIEVEIETLEQLQTYPLHLADYIMLDNFDMETLDQACVIIQQKGFTAQIEVSGNITRDTISRYKGKPIHRISVGALTHSVKAIDFSMRLV